MASPSFVHLDVRSFFSLKDGAFSPEDLARQASELEMPAVALSDRDGLYGAARFAAACEREGVRPILGATLTVRDPSPGRGDPPTPRRAASRTPRRGAAPGRPAAPPASPRRRIAGPG